MNDRLSAAVWKVSYWRGTYTVSSWRHLEDSTVVNDERYEGLSRAEAIDVLLACIEPTNGYWPGDDVMTDGRRVLAAAVRLPGIDGT